MSCLSPQFCNLFQEIFSICLSGEDAWWALLEYGSILCSLSSLKCCLLCRLDHEFPYTFMLPQILYVQACIFYFSNISVLEKKSDRGREGESSQFTSKYQRQLGLDQVEVKNSLGWQETTDWGHRLLPASCFRMKLD